MIKRSFPAEKKFDKVKEIKIKLSIEQTTKLTTLATNREKCAN